MKWRVHNEEPTYCIWTYWPDSTASGRWTPAVDLVAEHLVPRVGYTLHDLDLASRPNFGCNCFAYGQGKTVKIVLDRGYGLLYY